FSSGEARVLVATDIAARGVHVDDIALVVHVDPPAEHKAYLHRSGRTARAGARGSVVTIATPDQARDVNSLLRKAHIQATAASVAPGDTRTTDLTGPPAPRQAPDARPPRDPRQVPGGTARRDTSRQAGGDGAAHRDGAWGRSATTRRPTQGGVGYRDSARPTQGVKAHPNREKGQPAAAHTKNWKPGRATSDTGRRRPRPS
ncbi:MAG: helicase-related protein, partial [Acidimicrobiales bacterium]